MKVIIISILLLLGGIFWLAWSQEKVRDHQEPPSQLTQQREESPSQLSPVELVVQEDIRAPRVIPVLATNWYFEPDILTVEKGELIELQVTGGGVEHSLSLPAFGIEVAVKPDETKSIIFTPDKVGTFPMLCSVYCGDGHSSMTGRLIVTGE